MSAQWPAAVKTAWHPVAYLDAVTDKPLSVTLMDRPLVVFRSGQSVAVLDDRCPHRAAPLSLGRVVGDTIECPYHGWRFDGAGQCRMVAGSRECAAAAAKAWPVRLDHGLVWTSLAETPDRFVPMFSEVEDTRYDRFWWRLRASRGVLADAIENLLDPLHSYFLHPGLVRRSTQVQAVDIDLTVHEDAVSARYVEPREGMTLLQKVTEAGRIASWGHYRAPTQVQIAFEDAQGIHAAISVVFSPVETALTRPFTCFSTRKGWLPAWVKRALILAFHHKVLSQDLAMLSRQADNHDRFGPGNYRNGPVDFFGPLVWDGLNGRPLTPGRRKLALTPQD